MDISKLDKDQLVKYVNLEPKKNSNLNVNKLCDKLEIKRSTLKTKLQKENYFFNINNRSYEKNKAVIAIDDSVKDVIENDDTNKNKEISTNDNIMIELPVETEDNYRTTIRINNVVWENFKEFCAQNKMFTQRD